jgi:NlpC/P60 family putative phage cell wall peptidase
MMRREAIVAEAREWIGTRWRHQASLKGIGTDCIGLVAGVARALGMPEGEAFLTDIRFRGYTRTPNPAMLRRALATYWDATDAPLPGDVMLMRFEKEPQHFGILSERDYMIHALAQARKVTEHRIDETWKTRIVGFYRYRGVS